MMKSNIDLEDELYAIIKDSPLAKAVDGDIYQGPDERPDNSQLEDIEIIVIGNQNGDIQTSTINVNVYCRDERDGNKWRRNKPRLRTIARLGIGMFKKAINTEGYRITLESQGTYPEHQVNQHYVNFKLNYEYFNA